jgi:hypothetical protein
MWAVSGFSVPKQIQKDLSILFQISYLYLLYKKGGTNDSLKNEIYSLYHSQICDSSIQAILGNLVTFLHHRDDFITAFENPTLQEMGMSSFLWEWLEKNASFLYHLLHETTQSEEITFQLLLLMLALTAARNFSCIERDFWKWSNPTGKDFFSLFPGFITNYFYWKNYKNHAFHWKNCKKMFEEFLEIFPESLKKNSTYHSLFEALQSKYEQMKEAPSHWPTGPHGWPLPMSNEKQAGKWAEEMTQELLFYTSVDNGLVSMCKEVYEGSMLYNYTQKLFSLFLSPLSLNKVEEIIQTLAALPENLESKDPDAHHLFSSLHSWKNRFLHTTSFTIEFLDPKKETIFSAIVPTSLEFALFHPEQVSVELFSENGETLTASLSHLFTKKLVFKGLLEPRKELDPILLKLS